MNEAAGLIMYLGIGFFWVYLEHRTIEWDYEGMKPGEIVLGVLQQVVHYTRVCITWPSYVIEDFLVWASNYYYHEEEENDNE
jgi:hypothetical protein